jgi:3',5'-cyclic AMP phosphodiesterase CpdA
MIAPGMGILHGDGQLLAISDLHVGHPENRAILERLRPQSEQDWLIVCGDVSDSITDVEWALGLLASRFARVLWTPGNHELWSLPEDGVELRGERRYRRLVEICGGLEVLTPEDPYPVWDGPGGPVGVALLFLLYDYSFGRNIAPSKVQALALAHSAGVVCSDEFLLHPDPFATREQWCEARVRYTEGRLGEWDSDVPLVLATHFPLTEHPTRVLLHPEFAQWCGTTQTADWHVRFPTATVIYGHLHIPRTTWQDGVRFEEVSLGYPREWQRRGRLPPLPRVVIPQPAQSGSAAAR